jgi:HK97 family phage prohead protease
MSGVIEGVVLTFGTVAKVRDGPDGPSYREMIHPGALKGLDPRRVTLLFGNGVSPTVIGRAVGADVSDRHLAMAFQVASSARGEEALELAREGIVGDFGVTFQSIRHQLTSDRVIERLEIDLHRVDLVDRGAYQGTGVGMVRAAVEADDLQRGPCEGSGVRVARAIAEADLERVVEEELARQTALHRRAIQFINARP